MPKARGLPLLLLVMLPSLQLSLAATRRRQIEDLSSEVENLGEAEGVDERQLRMWKMRWRRSLLMDMAMERKISGIMSRTIPLTLSKKFKNMGLVN